ncbi:short-chain dehydrogenase/reductase [Paenibacillus pectinilyticus]|uniref:Short-chain dehydrogenase/reductase n=1 Tax=Paenibacillus pectinilyticus TaxID=512399 RepID=A0A1C0ZXA3_9BACL|nr:oxidoreductase [Paenibacillus pectinilyticus]OCT12751.1 short-chain dehydrogenase/reductase [Paenibacillus pectinilyticus]
MSQLEKVWFITGCSTGFGRQIAEHAIDAGYKVVVTARNVEQIQDITAKSEANTLALSLDVTNQDQIDRAVAKTIEKFGRIDVLINNAGIGYFGSVEESVEEETRKMFEINFWGLMHVTNSVLPHMRSQKSGHIINFSSIGGLTSFPTLGYYHATKYAVEGISESLAQEVAPFNIHVTLIEPSGFRTDWGGRSSVKTETAISELKESFVGQMLNAVQRGAGQEAGDPTKAAQAVIKVVEADKPPLRLLLGEAAYKAATYKFTNLLASIEEWKETTINADFKK